MTDAVAPAPGLRFLVDRRVIWLAFGVIHLYLVWANLESGRNAFGDVQIVYREWVELGFAGSWVGVDEPWVYPFLAWVPILISAIAGTGPLPGVWLALLIVMNAGALAALLREPRGTRLALVWLAFLLLLGPIAIGRIDGVTIPIVIWAVVQVRQGRTGVAAVLLTIGAWIKVWPGVVFLAVAVATRKWRQVLAAGAGVSIAVVALALALGSGMNVLSFLTSQYDRGLQVESVAATPLVWMAAFGDATIGYDAEILTFQVTGPGSTVLAEILTPLLIVTVLVILALGVLAERRGVPRTELFALLSLALVLALIVTNKVGSPQFVAWLAVPLILTMVDRRRGRRWIVQGILVTALLTQLIYPWFYGDVLEPSAFGVVIITLRNGLEVLLLVVSLVALARRAVRPRIPAELSSSR